MIEYFYFFKFIVVSFRDAFNLFDMDDDNYLDYFEIGAMFKLYDVDNVDPADCIKASDKVSRRPRDFTELKYFFKDGNGMIDFKEFKVASGM